jgi:tetratricopeptide (TPR) repeat protein
VGALACLLVVGLILGGPAILSLARLNAGMIALTRALMADGEDTPPGAVAQAEWWLSQVIHRAPENRAAWRGLGLALAAQGRVDEATAAWQKVPDMVSDLLLWGEHALLLRRYDQALEWYQWATRVEPAQAGPWYHRGRAHEKLLQWEDALQAYHRALELDDWSGLRHSSLHYRTGALYLRLDVPQAVERAWQAFEAALEADDFGELREQSDCHFQRGTILHLQERPVDEYIVEYERAVAIDPGHAAAQARLGSAYFERDQDLQLAEAHLGEALALDPKDGLPYVLLGDVYTGAGMHRQAAEMYEQALQFEALRDEAQRRLQALQQPGEGRGP